MGRNKTYIKVLTEAEEVTLEQGWKNGKSHIFRQRCHSILLSYQKMDVPTLATTLSVTTSTIYTWIREWKKHGIIGLITQPGQGRKPKLSIDNKEHIKVVEKAVKNAAEKGINMKDEIEQELEIEGGISNRTLRRFLKKKITPTRDFVDILRKQ